VTLIVAVFTVIGVFAQRTVTGTVISNDDRLGIPGVSIVAKGSDPVVGTTTDVNGKFSINIPDNLTVLVFSCIGMATQEKEIVGLSSIDVTMSSTATDLDAVVVIGYGSQKKKEVTGSVASLKQEDFNAGIKNNPMGLLQGKVAGLTIQRTSGGDPTNTGYNIQIRGFSTLDKGAGTSPLYIVDGIPVNNIDNIAPDDISSMDVLKDGSAAAIYGTRGTNGVIIITTKRGSQLGSGGIGSGASHTFEYSGYVSVSTRSTKTGMATTEQFRDLEKISNGKVIPVLYESADGKTYNTDWLKEITRPAALTHNHNISVSGITKNFSYRGSIAYKEAQGIALESNRREIIAKLAADQKVLNGWLDIQYDLSYMNYRNDYFTGDFKQASIVNPTYPVYDNSTKTGYYYPQGTGQSNPVEAMMQKESYQNGNYFRGSIRPVLNILPVEGLRISAFAAMEEGSNYNYWYDGVMNPDNPDKAGRKTSPNINKLFEATIDYANNFGMHNIAAVAGFSYQNFEYDGSDISNGGFAVQSIKYYSIGDGDATKDKMNICSYRNSYTLAAFLGRINYSFDEKFLLSISVRQEGSSRFGANNKWGTFPAVSAGWRIKRENFMRDVKWINDLKLRFGFGITGNNLASDLQSLSLMGNGGTFWYNGKWVYTYTVTRNVNDDLRWEKKYEYNVGIDFQFLDNRLYGTVDMYFRNTKDLLWDYEVPTPPYQYSTLLANAGEMVSKGIEITLNAVPVKTKNFSWTTSPTIAFNNNKITKLSDPSKGFNYSRTLTGGIGENGIMNSQTQILIEGESVGAFYGLEFLGFLNGEWYYRTPAGGEVDDNSATDAHKMVIGNAQPLFTFGWNNTFRYKNFDLTLFFRGCYGNKVLNVTRWAYGPSASQSMNVFMKDVYDGVYTNKSHFSDYYLEDGSFIKLDNITLGYSLPFKNSKYVRSMRIYATAQNVFTITKYSGVDPEVNTTSVWDPGIDYPDFYPNVRSFMLGINLVFN
ncbi:MAG: SusC/RagA family TonB-linked outer membrane protein, partial [Bacteroidales bacterium]|nr:SusC/RagA family TonB-linked outer membrane protein [Bacteroidales bacterium]